MTIIKKENLVNNPLASVIVPSFNRPDTIGQTIESIMTQNCNFDFELIIGDDCSAEQLKEILFEYQNRYPKNIVLLFQEENIGLGANWATCVKISRGKYIANCDDDDYWHNPDKLQIQVNFMETNPDCGMCYTDANILNRESNKISYSKTYRSSFNGLELQKIIFNSKFHCCIDTVLFRTSAIVEHVNLDDYIKYRFIFQDWNTMMILAKHTQFHFLNLNTATYRRGHESLSSAISYEKLTMRMEQEHIIHKYICDLFPEDFKYDENRYNMFIYRQFIELAYKKQDFITAQKYARVLINNGYKSIKIISAHYSLTFKCFALLKRMKQNMALFS